MGDGKRNVFDADARRDFAGYASEAQRWLSAGEIRHFDIHPAYAARPARAKRFHCCFLHRESPGVTLVRIPVPLAVFDFKRGEKAIDESPAVALDGRFDPIDFRDVDAHPDDHTHPSFTATNIEAATR